MGVTVARAVSGGLIACLLLLGAAGLSSLEDDDFCSEQGPAVEGTSWSTELEVWPPGPPCAYTVPGGREVTVSAGSVGSFLGVLAAEILIAAWVAREWPRVAARVAAATMLVFSVVGAGALLGGFVLAIVLGLSLGVPLAVIGDRALRRAAGREVTWLTGALLAAGAASAVLVAGMLWLRAGGGA